MDRLTRDSIEHFRIGERDRKDIQAGFIDALCDLALQSLSQEAVRDEALEEAEKRVVEAAIDEIQGSCTITCHNLQNAVMTLLAVRGKS